MYSSWTTNQNFCNMFEILEEKLIASNVAVCLETPVWKTRKGEIVSNDEKEKAIGCKCKIEITHPEMVILADEVGCNTSQRGDGHIGGDTFMCAKGKTPQKKQAKKISILLCWVLPY